jgi:hypothetical protein
MNPSDRQDRLLEAEDGRYFAIDKFGTGLGTIATEEQIGRVNVGFGLPSAPALYLHLAHKAFTAYRDVDVLRFFDQHPQGVWPDDQNLYSTFLSSSCPMSYLRLPPWNRLRTR